MVVEPCHPHPTNRPPEAIHRQCILSETRAFLWYHCLAGRRSRSVPRLASGPSPVRLLEHHIEYSSTKARLVHDHRPEVRRNRRKGSLQRSERTGCCHSSSW